MHEYIRGGGGMFCDDHHALQSENAESGAECMSDTSLIYIYIYIHTHTLLPAFLTSPLQFHQRKNIFFKIIFINTELNINNYKILYSVNWQNWK